MNTHTHTQHILHFVCNHTSLGSSRSTRIDKSHARRAPADPPHLKAKAKLQACERPETAHQPQYIMKSFTGRRSMQPPGEFIVFGE